MKLSRNEKLVAGGVLAWFAWSWLASSVAGAAVDSATTAARDAIEDAYHALEDDVRAVFDGWLEVYQPPLETASAALHALAAIASSPGAAVADAWSWWRSDYDPEGVTPEDAPGGLSNGGGAGSDF